MHPSDERFQELPRQRVADRIAAELKRLIAVGELGPGERLPGERQLAEMMNVSRVSVRAALQQLKAQGLVDAVQGGGTRVLSSVRHLDLPLTELVKENVTSLHDLMEVRAALEVWAARRAALHATPEQVAELASILESMTDSCRARTYKASDDLRFHLVIARATASCVYMHMLETLRDILVEMLAFHRYELLASERDDLALLAQHRAVYEAIRDRDSDAAARAMAAHLGWILEHYEKERQRRADGDVAGQAAE